MLLLFFALLCSFFALFCSFALFFWYSQKIIFKSIFLSKKYFFAKKNSVFYQNFFSKIFFAQKNFFSKIFFFKKFFLQKIGTKCRINFFKFLLFFALFYSFLLFCSFFPKNSKRACSLLICSFFFKKLKRARLFALFRKSEKKSTF